ncbi:hypothetical protein AB1Y20_016563 [Prymnesium parvum]|uniref:Pyruvate phosphate dikinase AMP/ATP-binding domain-containing protein n=1 Tax=Prymnesium parvum TaxID=97485 RepID=A0AB34IA73_PRYPA
MRLPLFGRGAAAALKACSRPLGGVRARSTAPPGLRLEPALENIISRFAESAKAGGALEDKSKKLVDDFNKLQAFRVQRVLLVCSDYDSYTFEEDGLLSEMVYNWYGERNLTKPPTIERVNSTAKALKRFKETKYDMVISLLRMEGHKSFIQSILQLNPTMPIGLLALNPAELQLLDARVDASQRLNVNKRLMWETAKAATSQPAVSEGSMADAWIWPLVWQGSPALFTAMFKAVEDRLNIRMDSEYGVQIIILVEDSVKFYSSFLPVLYSELWKHTQALASETAHEREAMLRRYARPKVMLCTNYEEALDIFHRYSDNVLGVISDMGFPKGGVHDMGAGLALLEEVKKHNAELPVLMQSSSAENSDAAASVKEMGARYVCKESPSLLHTLQLFMRDDLLLGPFKMQDGVTGAQLGMVRTVPELIQLWQQLPLTSVAYHARHQHLSRWFFARAEFGLAKRFRASDYPGDFIDETGNERPDWLRNWILSEVRAHRNKMTSFVESPENADPTTLMVRCGSGSLGGKGRGFRFLHSVSERFNLFAAVPGVSIVVPKCFVLATSVFDSFMEDNELLLPAINASSDEELQEIFTKAALPANVTKDLRNYLQSREGPLAVRSSSMFEDAFLQPFAGIYKSYMLPNQGATLEARLDELSWAVKMVYASTFTQDARKYAESTANRTEEEKMAVILQEVIGSKHGDYFYPSLAGVANAVDFYPRPATLSEHGCAQLGLGLGHAVVDGQPALHFSLGDPAHPVAPQALRVAALDLTKAPTSTDSLISLPIEGEQVLRTVRRSNDMELAPEAAKAVPLMQDVHGEQVVFKHHYGEVQLKPAAHKEAPLEQVDIREVLSGEVPLAKLLSFMLRLGTIGLGCPVEIEFALKLRKSVSERHELHLLQIRPQAQVIAQEAMGLRFKYLPNMEYAAMTSTQALGNGRFNEVRDVVYVTPDRFDKMSTAQIAKSISKINSELRESGRKYLLMAPGRWGSADPLNGIPVAWKDINGSSFIVETTLPGNNGVPLSQGTHFFQNLISFGLGYANVDSSPKGDSSDAVDYGFWDAQPAVYEDKFVRHVRLDTPLEIVVDGVSRRGVVMKPGKPFDVYVGQVDAFMALNEVDTNEC